MINILTWYVRFTDFSAVVDYLGDDNINDKLLVAFDFDLTLIFAQKGNKTKIKNITVSTGTERLRGGDATYQRLKTMHERGVTLPQDLVFLSTRQITTSARCLELTHSLTYQIRTYLVIFLGKQKVYALVVCVLLLAVQKER